MRLGLFGGTFDPIHIGHLRAARHAAQRLRLDRVLFLPTAVPPHKPDREFAPAIARFVMVELALLDQERLLASPLELTPGRATFTVHSLEHFAGIYPGAELFLLLGGDGFAQLTSWKRWRELPQLARVVILARPGWSLEEVKADLDPELARLAEGDRVQVLDNPPVEASSTELRDTLARGEAPPPGVIPDSVLEYIRKYSLYR